VRLLWVSCNKFALVSLFFGLMLIGLQIDHMAWLFEYRGDEFDNGGRVSVV